MGAKQIRYDSLYCRHPCPPEKQELQILFLHTLEIRPVLYSVYVIAGLSPLLNRKSEDSLPFQELYRLLSEEHHDGQRTVPLENLLVELQAGGLDKDHQRSVS